MIKTYNKNTINASSYLVLIIFVINFDKLMRNILILIILVLCYGLNAQDKEQFASVEVVVDNFESNYGFLRVHLYNQQTSQYFPDKSHKAYKLILTPIKNKKAKVVFTGIPFGKYALTIHHDANSNEKMDKNILGMPAEGWGLSTDIIPVFSLPDFEECSFEVLQPVVRYPVIIRYLP